MNYNIEGDIRMGGTVALDNTLTLVNAAAQAKAAGTAINEVKDTVNKHIADEANPHKVTKEQVGLGNVNNTSDATKPVSIMQAAAIKEVKDELTAAIADKVGKEAGKGLSTNDFTDAYKKKLDGIEDGANKYILGNNVVNTTNIAEASVTAPKLADRSVTASKVAFDYQTPLNANQIRAIHISTAEPTASNGSDGDIWFVYE